MVKKILFVILGLVVIIVLTFIFWSPKDKDAVTMNVKTIADKDNFFNIKAEYPQFNNIDEGFNKKISDLIENNITEFKTVSQENWQARKDTATAEFPVGDYPDQPFDFIAAWRADQINDNYISFYISIYSFSGGAHGDEQIYSFNYDVKNKKEITTQDVLKTETSLAKISGLAKTNLISQYQSNGTTVDENITQMIEEGIAPKYDNFETFTFNATSLTFYFQKYQVGPGSAGEFNFVVFNSMLDDEKISFIE